MEEKERLVREEAERVVREEAKRVMQRGRHQQEKLDLFLNKSITAEEFKKDSDAEADTERSKVTGEGVVEEVVGTQTSEMEVDDTGEDKVMAEDKGSKGGRKRAPSSPLKLSRKQARVSTTVALKPAAIEKADSISSTVNTCDRCRHFKIKCIPIDRGAQCSNCKAKHYKYSLVPLKEGSEGKGGSLAMHHSKTAAEGRVKAQEKKEAAKKVKAFHRVTLGTHLYLSLSIIWHSLMLASRSRL